MYKLANFAGRHPTARAGARLPRGVRAPGTGLGAQRRSTRCLLPSFPFASLCLQNSGLSNKSNAEI